MANLTEAFQNQVKLQKNKYGSYSNSYNHFLHCNFFARNKQNQRVTTIYVHNFLSFILVELKLKN